MLALLLALTSPALADTECARLCTALDDVEEACEVAHGDGGYCEEIGTVEATCDPEDGGSIDACPTLCLDVIGLDAACADTLGADPVCDDLNVLATDCADGRYDGPAGTGDRDTDDDDDAPRGSAQPTAAPGCHTTGSGLALTWWLAPLALRRRRAGSPCPQDHPAPTRRRTLAATTADAPC
jgi:hypothetical protein